MQHEIFIDTEISEWGFSARTTRDEIAVAKSLGAKGITVYINSGGGSVFEGYAIYNLLKESGLQITTHVVGLCASIASLIFLSGSVRKMSTTGSLMIHNPWAGMEGDADSLRKLADQLDDIKATVLKVYKAKSNLDEVILSEMMTQETWMSAEKAFEFGFATEQPEAIKNSQVIQIQMSANKSKVAVLIDRFSKFMSSEQPTMFAQTLEDGTTIYSEKSEIEVGSKLFTDEAMTAPVPDAAHRVKIGEMVWIVTTVNGEVTEMAEDSGDPLNEEIENLKNQLSEANAKLEEQDKTINEAKELMTSMKAELERLNAIELGSKKTFKSAQRQPDAKPVQETDGWQASANKLSSKFKKK